MAEVENKEVKVEQPTKVIGKFMWHIDDLLDILKESGE